MMVETRPNWYKALQQLKHRVFVAKKQSARAFRPVKNSLIDTALRINGRLRPYRFDPARYPGEFVALPSAVAAGPLPLPRKLTMFWLGGTEISENRQRGENSVRVHNPDIEVSLITDDLIESVLVPGHPLHPGYGHLALTHRSDYLRGYVMRFHGGGYCDVKTITQSWQPAFDRLSSSAHAWVLGYRELGHSTATVLPGRIQDDVRANFFRIIGNGAFIMRPGNPIAVEWLNEMNRRLDAWLPELELHPGGIYAGEEDSTYPIPKHGLLGDILGPLALKYHDRLIIDESIRPDFTHYR